MLLTREIFVMFLIIAPFSQKNILCYYEAHSRMMDHNMKFHPQSSRYTGFTLIEIMVVVVILSILAAMIVPKIMSRPDEARTVQAKQDLLTLQSALDLYKLDNGTYPTTEQGLGALVTKPSTPPVPDDWKQGGYLQRLPEDPWHAPYQYLNQDEEIRLFSYGPKGEHGDSVINLQ